MILQLRHISHHFGEQPVLADLDLTLNTGERIGIVGANGAGKSTLLRIAAGLLEPAQGQVIYAPTAMVGYVPQTAPATPGETLGDWLRAAQQQIAMLEARMQQLAAQLGSTTGEAQRSLLAAYGEAATRFELAGGYELEQRIASVMQGLGIAHLTPSHPITHLSGGERTRVALATLLLRAPDLLLLDEPTNHLDTQAAAWLDEYLTRQTGAVLVVSHDRLLLDRAVHSICEIEATSLTRFGGNYTAYRAAKQHQRRLWEVAYARQQEQIAELRRKLATTTAHTESRPRPPRDNDRLVYNFKGQRAQHSSARQMDAYSRQLDALLHHPVPRPPQPLVFTLPAQAAAHGTGNQIEAHKISVCYAGQPVLHALTLRIAAGARILLQGANGAGKSTLLRVLVGLQPPDSGQVLHGSGAQIGYLPQEIAPPHDGRTVLDAYCRGRVGFRDALQAELLALDLLAASEIHRPLRSLSAGQQRRFALACLLTRPSTLLVLDEPTNHLSLDLVEQLQEALARYRGALLVVSHDRQFTAQFHGARWHLADGHLHHPA